MPFQSAQGTSGVPETAADSLWPPKVTGKTPQCRSASGLRQPSLNVGRVTECVDGRRFVLPCREVIDCVRCRALGSRCK